MPIVHIWLAMGLRSPYPAHIPLSVRQEAAVRFSYGFTGSAASTIWFSEKFCPRGPVEEIARCP